MNLDPTGIAQDLEHQTAEHADEKAPDAVSNAQPQLQQQNHDEDGHVRCISRQRGDISNGCLLQTACLQCALILLDGIVAGRGHFETMLDVDG